MFNVTRTCRRGSYCPTWSASSRAAGVLVIAAAILGVVVACTGSAFYFTGSNDVSRQFEEGELLAGHRYYTGGPDLKPNAIVAIDTAYTLESPHWRAMEVTPASLKTLVDRIRFVPYAEYKTTANGARIFAPGGRQIGVWYSVFDYTQVRMAGGRTIYLAYPAPQLPMELRTRIGGSRDD